MDHIDQLIEYYFQRKLSGMSEEEISKSLSLQSIIDDDHRVLIIRVVMLKEQVHHRQMQRKKQARYLQVTGILAMLAAISFSFTSYSGPLLIRLLAALGILVLLGGVWVSRSKRLQKSL